MNTQVAKAIDGSRRKSRSALLQLASGLIGTLTATCAFAQDPPSSNDDAWRFAVTPYLWMASLTGNTRIGPTSPTNVDAPFSDVVGNLSAAFMGLFEARKDRWVILVDTFYVGLFADFWSSAGRSTRRCET